MEEKKTLKIKKPYLIIFALAIAFAIMGFIDLKVNAAELSAPTISEQYLNYTYVSDVQFTNGNTSYLKDIGTLQANPQVRVGIYVQTDDGGALRYCLRYDPTLNKETRVSIQRTEIYNGTTTESTRNDLANGVYFYPTGGYTTDSYHVKYTLELDTNIPIFKDITSCINYLNTGVINEDDLYDVPIDYSKLQTDDSMPIVSNLNFDRIVTNEKIDGYINTKIITDYIRFDANHEYQLAIMVCPSIYSTFGSSGFIKEFEIYDYDKWIYMTTSDKGLKEISCEIGQFSIPTSGADSIVESNYKEFYNSILYSLSDDGSVNFKPTMGYRLMYVDFKNKVVGPSTYILPNYYDNLDPDDETCSFFTLYSDGTKGSEKVMNLKTWQQDENMTLDDVKEVINKVTNVLDDYQIIDTELGVGDARNWLQSVASFIKGTPSFVGSVMSFLPEPIRYGMYVCLFLGVIASGYAIVKALI